VLTRQWQKSSFSSNQDCVEAKLADTGAVEVRDSKNPDGVHLHFERDEWEALLQEVVG